MVASGLSLMCLFHKLPNMNLAPWFLLTQLVVLVSVGAVSYQQFEEISDPDNSGVTLQRMTQDETTGRVYVGSVNRLYRLTGDLALEIEVFTGPVEDNPKCGPPSRPCSEAKVSTNNINKALVVDVQQRHLISCGQVFQGLCQIRRLSNLSTVEEPEDEVVTNTVGGSNLAFIAPGADGSVLYTAASRGDWLRRTVPTVAKRTLYSYTDSSTMRTYKSLQPLASKLIPQNTLEALDSFDINYIYGFSSEGFSYFIATQIENFEDSETPLYTKVVSLCQTEVLDSVYSYIELPLVCKDAGNVTYNLAKSAYVTKVGSDLYDTGVPRDEDVLFVTFSSDGPTRKSVICMYPVRKINEGFLQRRIDCAMKKTDNTEIGWLGASECAVSSQYIQTLNNMGPSYCHNTEFQTPLGGLHPSIEAQAIYSTNSSIEAVAALPHNGATVILLGDERGNLTKLRVQSPTKARLYEELSIVSGSRIIQNGLMLTPDKQYVFVMTERMISKVPIETCESLTTCGDCLRVGMDGTGDPHCGWCPLQNSCTRRSEMECPGATDVPSTNRWIDSRSPCIHIQSVTPSSIPSDAIAQLTLNVTSLPVLNNSLTHRYQCFFDSLGSTDATAVPMDNSLVQCSTPAAMPVLQGGELTVTLSLRATETDKLIVNTTFDFYNCSAFESCTQCVADYLCNWCIFENKCMGNASSCNSTGVIAGQEVQNMDSPRKGKEYCPRIDNNNEILIPAGEPEPQDFTVNVASLPVESGYQCALKHPGWEMEAVTPGIRLDDSSIRCSARKYNYTMDENTIVADLRIRWNGGRFVLDNPSMLNVTLYKCAVKRADCGKCLLADAKFSCGWCEEAKMCSRSARCPVVPGTGQRWLSGVDLCPDPRITMFDPKSGHVAGGTKVVIKGFNLGQSVSDIRRVTVAGMPCRMLESEYTPAERIVCMTNSSTDGAASGPVIVVIGRGNSSMPDLETVSEENFSFVVPSITNVHPLLGPKAGGSRVTLTGIHLNAGGSRTITVAGMPCDLADTGNLSGDAISCITSPSETGNEGPVTMTFDAVGAAVSSSNFTYTENPSISKQDRTQMILSGGLSIAVMGVNLDVVQEPKMEIQIRKMPGVTRSKRQASQQIDSTIITKCTVLSSTSMECKSPDLSKPELAGTFTFDNSTSPPSFILPGSDISFVMDGVTIMSQSDFRVFVDPEYFMFEEVQRVAYKERKMLEIKGRYIKATYMSGDVTVTVGNLSCSPLMQNEDSLTCEAPENEVGQTYNVVVYHGNLEKPVGRVEYLREELPLAIIIGAVCGVALIIFIVLFIICIWRRISANERRFKKMESQRDEMEMRVAQECKDAFAELQITVLTVSSDVEGSGIPFRDYRDYVARLLFPENPCHPVFREIPVVRENISGIKRNVLEKALVQFGNLITNHTFLAIFVRTLENQKSLSLKDRSNIASLLVIALHNKLDFLTQAVKLLLQDLIKVYTKEGRAQLLLRRSEAVVEKLVAHWLSILMYDSLKDSMGKPLFHLFYAIKQQIDKGPVDAVTGEARYGLSEMKVIRQQIDFKTLNIKTNSLDITSEPIQLKVLDCDTISQTKDKILDAIYKSCPFSKRPMRDELDLEWCDRPDGPGSMILLDDDGRGRFDGEWKRINTLAYYQVPDGATLRLVRAQPNGGSLPNTPARKYGTLPSPATSSSPIIDQERGATLWHLVKHVDSGSLRKGERDQKMMAEIYLPRLLTTKGILQQFVDELLETIFNGESDVPIAVKYLFDFLDEQATSQGITNPDVAHAWKSNCLQLRFWVNLIMNPTVLFDINKTDTVDACVSIIGQTLIDSCSVSEQHLTKDSPSNKLLYAKDIPQYKQWVAKYYKDINDMPSISDQDMSAMLAAHTNRYQNEFQPLNALNELYFCYACIFKSEILQSLDEDKEAQRQGLGDKLEDIFRLMADSA
ncbi:plexin-A2-like [Acanthaster planci]|uniref:Plexin-A2-like n=1 Tax=Acanthaster planci TaxID=133434 RepID=A0A8B7ZVI0_ACAPL|nr:plexin-A2-like [Acanthaster planci]XP_022109097.1 plexin-A2-like [Acanthaster planci]